jgi:hypothetical protein
MVDMTPLSVADDAAQDDLSWLASQHGTDMVPSVTLDIALFTALSSGVKDQWLQGAGSSSGSSSVSVVYDRVRSGVPLGKVAATGAHGPYDDTATDGRQTLVGLLYGDARFSSPSALVGGALFVHGMVRESRLPVGVDAAGKSDVVGRIRFA